MLRPLWRLLLDDPGNLDCDECFAVMEYWAGLLAEGGVDLLADIQKLLARCPACYTEYREALHRLEATRSE
jgi:hypothetical protein